MAVRRETTRAQYARRGVVVAVVSALAITMSFLHMKGYFNGSPVVEAKVANAGAALTPGADVKLRGVIIGRVRSVVADPDGQVNLSLRISDDKLKKVPNNVVARILPATVFGTTYVDLTTPDNAPSPVALKAGAVIPPDETQQTLELQQALDDIDRIMKALGPGELATALQAAAQALDGRGAEIGEIVKTADDYVTRLNPRVPQLQNVIKKLADNIVLANELAPDFFDATDDALVTARMIAEEKASITNLLTGGRSLFTDANGLLTRNKDAMIKFVNESAFLMTALYDTRSGIGSAINTHIFLQRTLGSAMVGGMAHMNVYLNFAPAPYYGPQDCPQFGAARGDNCGAGRASARSMIPAQGSTP